jgi:hypothetical protein
MPSAYLSRAGLAANHKPRFKLDLAVAAGIPAKGPFDDAKESVSEHRKRSPIRRLKTVTGQAPTPRAVPAGSLELRFRCPGPGRSR